MSTTTNYVTNPTTNNSSWIISGGGGAGGASSAIIKAWPSYDPAPATQPDSLRPKLLLAIAEQEKLAEEAKKKNLNFAVVVHEAIAEALRSLL